MIEQGYDGSFNGPAYGSVAFQNVNQSVRVTDEFMNAARSGSEFGLRMVKSGRIIEHVDATSLLEIEYQTARISVATLVLQYEDTIQRWHTCSASGPINSSNPCSEYMFLDDSACNLASLNLRKFQKDGAFDVERFRAATRIFITAMEIIVDNAGYPSRAIAENSHRYRPLGLGFANLGALIMAMGLPYDSEQGRAVAGAIMAIEHAEAYARSAEIAANVRIGPFEGFAANRESMLNVMRMHQAAAEYIPDSCPGYLLEGAKESLARMVELGERYGYRNAQATVLAPTGTIAFMMDCDTTGIEPDIALVKYKLLAGQGDGVLKIVNRTVPEALARLGYNQATSDAIIAYVDENDTIEGAPDLRPEHLPVFDCAFKPMNGERSIHAMGHVRMMAACQPFVSGAISKTVNMPEEVTTKEISEAYMEGWRLGLKALAIYRENSKRSQPLATSEGGNTKQASDAVASTNGQSGGNGVPEPQVIYKPVRRRLPDDRPSVTHKFALAGHEGYLNVGMYPETGQPGELFVRMAKEGSTISGLMDAFATSISIALQYGVPLEDLCRKFAYMRFEPAGFTNNRQIPQATSVMDYIFKYLEQKFLQVPPEEEHLGDGVQQEMEKVGPAEDEIQMPLPFPTPRLAPATTLVAGVAQPQVFQNQDDAPPCSNCGSIMVRNGACFVCVQCGSSSGCG